MADSFVFYKSFYNAIKLLPSDSEKWEVLSAMFNLAFNGVEPELADASDEAKIIYYVTCEQIKASIQHRIDGAKGGRPRKTELKTPVKTLVNTNANVNVNVNDNVNDNVNVNIRKANVNASFTQVNYSKIIYSLFHDAGLPCARNNEISFLQTDFNNALNYIHNSAELHNLHSDDVIQAVKNYIEVLNDSNTWVSQKMNFYSLVKSKLFYNLLPANYSIENYKKFSKDDAEKPEMREFYSDVPCPYCHETKLVWSNQRQLYECRNCGADVHNEEIGGMRIEREAEYER